MLDFLFFPSVGLQRHCLSPCFYDQGSEFYKLFDRIEQFRTLIKDYREILELQKTSEVSLKIYQTLKIISLTNNLNFN